jgi:hypothetical protein
MALRATKGDEDADAGARFGLSWSCAVAGRGVFAVSSPCLQPSAIMARRATKGDENRPREEMANLSLVGSRFFNFKGAELFGGDSRNSCTSRCTQRNCLRVTGCGRRTGPPGLPFS